MQSNYALRSITDRTTLPGWAAQLAGNKLGPAAATTAVNGVYTMTAQQQSLHAGPAVSGTYLLGRYGEDYAYVPGSGDLDQFSGRWCKTPEVPNGSYAYFLPIDAAGNPIFPFIVNRQMYGQPNGSGKVTSITESVTVAFNVAPVVSGPAGVSLPHAGTLAFPGANAIAVSDVDAADEESVALSVTAGIVRTGGFQLVKRGGGTLIITGANSHTGGTRVEAGEVVVRNVAALGSGPIWVSPGAKLTLDVGAADLAVAAITRDAGGLIDVGHGRMTIASGGVTEAGVRS